MRGESLFFSERLECHHCHSSFNLSGSVQYVGKEFRDQEFFNIGLYNIDGTGAYPDNNSGIFEFTQKPEDMGRFQPPRCATSRSPRRTCTTAASPPSKESSTSTQRAAGTSSRARTPGTAAKPFQSTFVREFILPPDERAAILAFLQSLTDEEFLHDPRFSNPWPAGGPGGP